MIFKKLNKVSILSWLTLWSAIFMLGLLPILSDWTDNRYQVTLVDLLLPVVLALLLSLILTFIFYKGFRKNKFAALAGAIISILILGQGYDSRLSAILPFFKALSPLSDLKTHEGIFFSLVFVIVIVALTLWLARAITRYTTSRKWEMDIFFKGVMIVILVAFLLQLYPTITTIVQEWPQFFYRPTPLSETAKSSVNKPDIYYIVLDRYANQNVLKSQLNYDNSNFINFLQNNNFSVDPNAHSNYPFTTMSVASTLNASYNSDIVKKFADAPLQTLEPYHDSIRYASVIQEFKSLGYSYSQLGTWYEASNQAPLADHNFQPEGQLTVLGHTFTLNNFSKDQLTENVFWQFVKSGFNLGSFKVLTYSGISEKDATLYKIDQLKQIAAQPAGGKLIFAHILVPHDPYYFNADGSLSTTSDSNNIGEPIKDKYIGQVQFVNSQMTDLVSQIRKNSNNQAVIVMQADEGPYPMQLNGQNFNSSAVGDELDYGDMTKWSTEDLQMKFGVLAAYDVPDAKASDLPVAGNSVNIFRLILNSYFSANLPYLPECSYAFTGGRTQSFVYKDITARLTGKANPACPADSKF